MGSFPKKINGPNWVNEDDFTWDSTHKFFYAKYNTSKWDNEKKILSNLKKLYDEVYTNVVFVVDNSVIPFIYDFVVPDKTYVVEYNGEEHYHYTPEFYTLPTDFLKKVQSDFEKILFCNEYGYKYLPISYDQNITIDGLKYYMENYAGDIHYIFQHYRERYKQFDKEWWGKTT